MMARRCGRSASDSASGPRLSSRSLGRSSSGQDTIPLDLSFTLGMTHWSVFRDSSPASVLTKQLLLTGAEVAGHCAGSNSAPLTPSPLSPSGARGEDRQKSCPPTTARTNNYHGISNLTVNDLERVLGLVKEKTCYPVSVTSGTELTTQSTVKSASSERVFILQLML